MSVDKHWLLKQSFTRSFSRHIDRETLIDLLGIVIYEADRSALLEQAGYTDEASAVECLFDYVLDALGVPPSTDSFSRTPFEMLFYSEFWLDKEYGSLGEVLSALESLRDKTADRVAQAQIERAKFQVIKPDHPQEI